MTVALPPQPATGSEAILAEVLAGVVDAEHVSIDSHFFEDLGADSMVMTRFCARVRKRADLPPVSIKDVYRHPTIRSLAAALADDEAVRPPEATPAAAAATPAGTPQHVLAGTLQVLFALAYAYLAALVLVQGYEWVSAGSGLLEAYAQARGLNGPR